MVVSMFTRRSIEKIVNAVRFVERNGRIASPPQSTGAVPMGALVHVKSGMTEIDAAPSVDQMSSGTGNLWYFDETGAGTDTEIEVTLWHKDTSAPFPAETHALASRAAHGYILIYQEGACA